PLAIMNSMPGRPQTLAISCGSLTVAMVPWITAMRANSEGMRSELSMWTCASMKPGRMKGRFAWAPAGCGPGVLPEAVDAGCGPDVLEAAAASAMDVIRRMKPPSTVISTGV